MSKRYLMHKTLMVTAILLLLAGYPVNAGMVSYSESVDGGYGDLDPVLNRMYVSMAKVKNSREIDTGFTTNIAIVNLSTNETTYIFKKGFNEQIYSFYFEIGVSPEGVVSFNNDAIAKNNWRPKEQGVKDKMCICTFNPKTKLYSLWFCTKTGQNLKRVKSFNHDYSWWIDIKNGKIYLMRQLANKLLVSSIRW